MARTTRWEKMAMFQYCFLKTTASDSSGNSRWLILSSKEEVILPNTL
jgi:hypothetical protein